LNSSGLFTMFFIPGVVFTTEHIHKNSLRMVLA